MANQEDVMINHFDRGKPFYPLIINYLILLGGLKELALEGILSKLITDSSKSDIVNMSYERKLKASYSSKVLDVVGQVKEDELISEVLHRFEKEMTILEGQEYRASISADGMKDVEAGLVKLAKPLELLSNQQGTPIVVPHALIAEEIVSNSTYLLSHTMRAAGSLLIIAYETTKQHHDKGPLWEFLRHCRNAIAHNGKFNLLNDEPRRLAVWGKLQIEAGMHENYLFMADGKTPGFLGPGDPIRLLWDIEQAYPKISD